LIVGWTQILIVYSTVDLKDHTSVCSRTGFIITLLGGNPVVWQSKLQTDIALSTMGLEYIALSTAMWSLIHLRNVDHEVVNSSKLPKSKKVGF